MSMPPSSPPPSTPPDTLPSGRVVDATILAKNFQKGRAEHIRLIVLHSTENACAPHVARNVATWFAGDSAPKTSAHYVVGPDETIAMVNETDTAWHVGAPVNAYSIGVEQVGLAAYTPADWASPCEQQMLARSVALVADIAARNGIPPVLVDAAGLLRGDSGITTHALVTDAFHKTTHTDPGKGFPLDDYIARVASAVQVLQPSA